MGILVGKPGQPWCGPSGTLGPVWLSTAAKERGKADGQMNSRRKDGLLSVSPEDCDMCMQQDKEPS